METAILRTRSPNISSSHWLSAARFSSGTTAACSVFAAIAADARAGLTSREVGREAGREAGRDAGRDPGREAGREVGRLLAMSSLLCRDAAAMGGPLGLALRASSAARRAAGFSPSSGTYLRARFHDHPKHV